MPLSTQLFIIVVNTPFWDARKAAFFSAIAIATSNFSIYPKVKFISKWITEKIISWEFVWKCKKKSMAV